MLVTRTNSDCLAPAFQAAGAPGAAGENAPSEARQAVHAPAAARGIGAGEAIPRPRPLLQTVAAAALGAVVAAAVAGGVVAFTSRVGPRAFVVTAAVGVAALMLAR